MSQSAPQPQIVYTTAAAIQQQQQHQQQQQQLQQQQLQQQQLQQQQLLIAAEEEPKTVLRVIIEQMVCSVSIELLKQVSCHLCSYYMPHNDTCVYCMLYL